MMSLIALHDGAGSGNPLGISVNYDRISFRRLLKIIKPKVYKS